jgi:branched-subunit amino acid aminotransferase/4-amino-4-deoxychorismate lyase
VAAVAAFSCEAADGGDAPPAVVRRIPPGDPLRSPRAWLESSLPGTAADGAADGAADAYTVVRCDLTTAAAGGGSSRHKKKKGGRIWELPFHLRRLRESHRAVAAAAPTRSSSPRARRHHHLDRAAAATDEVIRALLLAAAAAGTGPRGGGRGEGEASSSPDGDPPSPTLMLTILWSGGAASAGGDDSPSAVRVRGHACSAPVVGPSSTRSSPPPGSVSCVVAGGGGAGEELPSRRAHPEAKLSSWCRDRRPLEDMFLNRSWRTGEDDGGGGPAVTCSEVLLQREATNDGGSIELLEGLTSNLFVVTREDGGGGGGGGAVVLRTASDGILPGCARHLVLRAADHLGLKVDLDRPVYLQDAGEWQEVFLTSAIKLIQPVDKILLPAVTSDNNNNDSKAQVAWSIDPALKQFVWRDLYDRIIEEQLR